jgi:hypothetical protein
MSKVGVHKIPNGTLEVLADGTKIQKTNDGNKLVVHPDGTKVQTTKDVSRTICWSADGTEDARKGKMWPHPTFHTRHHSASIYSARTQWTQTHGSKRTEAKRTVPPHIRPPCATPLPTSHMQCWSLTSAPYLRAPSACPPPSSPSFLQGTRLEVRPDGSRTQEMPDGTVLENAADGRTKQTQPDGTILETSVLQGRGRRVAAHLWLCMRSPDMVVPCC